MENLKPDLFGLPWAELPLDCPADTEKGAWLISPAQHLAEFVVMNCVALGALWIALNQMRGTKTWSAFSSNTEKRSIFTVIDRLFLVALFISYAMMVYHKIQDGRIWFLTQPCHCLHLLLMYCIVEGPSFRGSFCFNIYLYEMFAVFLGTIAADTNNYKKPAEMENWLMQHILLHIIPLYYMYSRRFPVVKSNSFFVLSYAIATLHGYMLMFPPAVITGWNLNHFLCPPTPFIWLGRKFRVAICLGGIVVSYIMRYLCLGLIEYYFDVIQRPTAIVKKND